MVHEVRRKSNISGRWTGVCRIISVVKPSPLRTLPPSSGVCVYVPGCYFVMTDLVKSCVLGGVTDFLSGR